MSIRVVESTHEAKWHKGALRRRKTFPEVRLKKLAEDFREGVRAFTMHMRPPLNNILAEGYALTAGDVKTVGRHL